MNVVSSEIKRQRTVQIVTSARFKIQHLCANCLMENLYICDSTMCLCYEVQNTKVEIPV